MATLHIFPDTNLLLHFKRPEHVDWVTLTGASSIVIVLAPVVIEELDDLKTRPDSRKIKQRARDLNSWVRTKWRDPDNTLRPGVVLEFALAESDDHLTGGLLARVKDDRLIACALSYAAEGKTVALATNDTGPLIKAEARGLRVIEPPSDWALPLERDEVERDRDELRRTLDDIRSREPKLELAWQSGTGEGRISIPEIVGPESPSKIVARFPAMRLPGSPSPPGFAGLASLPPIAISVGSVEAYNAELTKFHERYAAYHREEMARLDHNRRLIDLAPLVRNVGGASATHVSVRLELPDTILADPDLRPFTETEDAPEPPPKPSAFGIYPPQDIMHLARGMALVGRRSSAPRFPFMPKPANPLAPAIEGGGRVVIWNLPHLTHSDAATLIPVRCQIAPELVNQSAEMKVTLHSHEQSAPQSFRVELWFIEVPA